MARKTVDVKQVRDQANRALSDPVTIAHQDRAYGESRAATFRIGVAMVLETILMDTGNYKGFQYADGQNGHRDHTKRRYY